MPETNIEDEFNPSQNPSKPAHINHRIIPYTENAKAIVFRLVEVALVTDAHSHALKGLRKRPKDMVEKLRYCLSIYLSNLIYLSFDKGRNTALRMSRSKRIQVEYRYIPEAFTIGASREAQDILSSPEIALITMNLGVHCYTGGKGMQTTLIPSERLLIAVKALCRMDFCYKAEQEVIVLKSKQQQEHDYSKRPVGKRIDYVDTDYTNIARDRLESINEYLSRSDIKLRGEDLPQKNRQLVRYFNESFDRGGRLFGGRWQGSKEERKHYTINGKKCVEVDFVACAIRLAYAKEGLSLDEKITGDPYTLTGEGNHYKRPGIKRIVAAMCCMAKPMTRFPRHSKAELGAGDKERVHQVREVLEEHFADITDLFYRGIGLELMHTESEILIKALLTLQSKGIVALPIHDCVVVSEDDQEVACKAMLDAFREVSGQNGKVDVKPL